MHEKRSAKKAVTQCAPDAAETISKCDLFPFGISAPAVGYGNFEDAALELGDLCGNLGFKAKAILVQANALEQFAPENLVTGPNVREVQVRAHVGKQREEPVANRMPEI